MERIFMLFERLETEAGCPGNGIGLPICRKIIENHDGRIWVTSHPGKSSTFYFTLPR
jgi:light-regulated signal transduction histidine kinase (bacteriophytochrome)